MMTTTTTEQRNWAGNYTYHASAIHYPETLEQLQAVVSQSSSIKVLGSRHSFNDLADTTGEHVSLERFAPTFTIDAQQRTVTVAAGAKYGDICKQIHQAGYALHNLASLPHISVAGACASATHGSGERNGNLATAVAALELVTAEGDVVTLRRDEHADFHGAVVGLGGLGVVSKVTLDVVPTFEMRQNVYENLPFSQLEAHFDEIEASAYSVSLFTDWQSEQFTQVWLKSRVDDDAPLDLPPSLFGATPAPTHRHPLLNMSAENCTPQMGIPGPWYERMPHFRMEFTPSSGAEIQSEYFVARQHAVAAIRALAELRTQIAPHIFVTEVRTVAADSLWMSPAYGQDSVGLHFTWKPEWPAVRELLPYIEAKLAPFDARPHWAKQFTMAPAAVQALLPKLPEFRKLLANYDPTGKFRNHFLDTYIYEA